MARANAAAIQNRSLSCTGSSSLAAVQDGRQRLVDQQAQCCVQQALDQRKGHIEDDQTLDEAVCGGQDRLKEAVKLGFSMAIIPKANAPKQPFEGLTVIGVERIDEAFDRLRELQ